MPRQDQKIRTVIRMAVRLRERLAEFGQIVPLELPEANWQDCRDCSTSGVPNRILTEVARRCADFRVRFIAADGGGNGHVLNRLFLDRLGQYGGLYAIMYSAADHEPFPDGMLTKWTVNRSASIGVLFSRIKKQQILFPRAAALLAVRSRHD